MHTAIFSKSLSSFRLLSLLYFSDSARAIQNSYDFIIVGGKSRLAWAVIWHDNAFIAGGTAGLTLANRLTEAGNQTALMLEAGSEPGVIAAARSPCAVPLFLVLWTLAWLNISFDLR
jgi:choline dehydrogenase